MATLSKETARRWLLCLESLDRLVRKSDAHWDYGTIPEEPEYQAEMGIMGPPIGDEDFHRLFEWAEYAIREAALPEALPAIRLAAHDYASGE